MSKLPQTTLAVLFLSPFLATTAAPPAFAVETTQTVMSEGSGQSGCAALSCAETQHSSNAPISPENHDTKIPPEGNGAHAVDPDHPGDTGTTDEAADSEGSVLGGSASEEAVSTGNSGGAMGHADPGFNEATVNQVSTSGEGSDGEFPAIANGASQGID